MSHGIMTADAIKFLISDSTVRRDGADEFTMAIQARCIQHGHIDGPDLNRLVKILESECFGMMITVARLGQPFAGKIVRHMAVAACRECVVARFLPALKLLPHDMAIGAGFGITC